MIKVIDIPPDKIVISIYKFNQKVKSGKKEYVYPAVNLRISYQGKFVKIGFLEKRLKALLINLNFKLHPEIVENKYIVIEPEKWKEMAKVIDKTLNADGKYYRKIRKIFVGDKNA